MIPSKLSFALRNLENLDPRFLDPHVSLVVMPEETELALDDAKLALEGLSCMLESLASANVKLRKADQNTQYVELPPDCLGALLRMVTEKIAAACDNPTLKTLRHVRPDLFHPTN